MTNHGAQNQQVILNTLALQYAAEQAMPGENHGSSLAVIAADCWQAKTLHEDAEVAKATTIDALRLAMSNPDVAVIFIPATAAVSEAAIEQVLVLSGLSKLVVWAKG